MKKKILLLSFLSGCIVLPHIAAAAERTPAADRYIVVLKAGKSVPDLARYGGKVEHATLWGVAVLLPPDRVDELRHDPAVKYLQKAALGPVQSDDAASSPRVAATSLRTATDQAPPTWTSGTYAYDGAGNIMGLGPNGDGRASTFIYDAASRLTQATIGRAAGDRTETYGYDGYGNLTSRAIAGGVTYANNVNISTNQLQAPATYDAAGDLTTLDGTTTYAYDPFSMMREKDSASGAQELYVYTPSDERIGIDTNVTWEWTVRDFDGKPLREYVSDAGFSIGMTPWLWVEDYVWRDGQLLGADRPSEEGGRRHFHVDHLGSPRLMTDAHGSMIAQHDYAPFGSEITPVNQELVAGFDREEPLNFTGHRRDFDRSTSQDNANYIDYMHARYYETNYGRFMEVDPLMPIDAMKSPQLWNRYAYVGNNPVGRVDPTGKILEFSGSTDDLDKVKRIANSGLNGYQLKIGANGAASLAKTRSNGRETKEQKAFREGLQRVITDRKTTAINVASHASGVVVGQFDGPAGRTIDPTDMEKFGSAQPSAASTLGHEVMEQYAGQVLGMTHWSAAHAWAILQENTFTGWTRGGQTPTQWLPNGLAYGDVFYSRGRETIDVRVTVDPRTYDVTSVTRTPVP